MNLLFPTGNRESSLLQQRRVLLVNHQSLTKTLARLATAKRINQGSDDPAGLIASENLQARLAALDAETRSFQRASSVSRVAEGALSEVSNALIEANGLAVANASSAGLSQAERDANQLQINALVTSVNHIANTTTFAGQSLFNGNLTLNVDGTSVALPALTSGSLGQVDVNGQSASLADLSTGGPFDTSGSAAAAQGAQLILKQAINDVATLRGQIGSFEREAQSRIEANSIQFEQVSAANSIIRDTDYATETANFVRLQILQKANYLNSRRLLDLFQAPIGGHVYG